ncbi:NUDIX hydrolase [Haloarcula litorea]|uniref:NUDIX hydrolase n=1 Tax=Haloarcula litorea TaxID=3032579 RepID=UPI0023E8AD2C|nr:NUDIX hydrolase [Halomicroarcula sp. GDY20]
MPSLNAFGDGVYTRRVTRAVDATTFDAVRTRVEAGLEWGVGALAEDDDGRALLVYEDDIWKLPGGGVEPAETREAALVREVREETGVEVGVDELLAVSEVTLVDGARETEFHFGTYRATPESTDLASNPGLADEDIERVAWKRDLPENCLDGDLLRRVR